MPLTRTTDDFAPDDGTDPRIDELARGDGQSVPYLRGGGATEGDTFLAEDLLGTFENFRKTLLDCGALVQAGRSGAVDGQVAFEGGTDTLGSGHAVSPLKGYPRSVSKNDGPLLVQDHHRLFVGPQLVAQLGANSLCRFHTALPRPYLLNAAPTHFFLAGRQYREQSW